MGGHAAIMVKQRYQVTEMPNKAPRNYPQLSPLELLRGDLKGMFGAVAGSGLLPDDMQDLGVVGKYAPRECSNCGSDQVRVIFAEFEFKCPSSYEKHIFEIECTACGKFTQKHLEQTHDDELTEEWEPPRDDSQMPGGMREEDLMQLFQDFDTVNLPSSPILYLPCSTG